MREDPQDDGGGKRVCTARLPVSSSLFELVKSELCKVRAVLFAGTCIILGDRPALEHAMSHVRFAPQRTRVSRTRSSCGALEGALFDQPEGSDQP